MKINFNKFYLLPYDVRTFLLLGGWLTGTGARYILDLSEAPPADWDILIPFPLWAEATEYIPKGTPANSFGGFKLQLANDSVDVWPDDLARFAAQVPPDFLPCYCVHFNSTTVVEVGRATS